ncbi:MAG: YcjX family protein [Hyphomicrobiaceae bacterium]|nr:YcjX family protein [Hyphomicrobiaceae bacterium]
MTPTVRLGVTGLSRSGKTVLITGLVETLTNRSADPSYARLAGIPGLRAYLEPQPDDDVPRFQYEEHSSALAGTPPAWPESTRRISQLRLTLEWESSETWRQWLGMPARLHVDIVDYPGEWLIDLAMMGQSFAEWSEAALTLARSPALSPHARPFLQFLADVGATAAADEQVAIAGASLFTSYLAEARRRAPAEAALGPGRFLLPGDLEGSPQLTFFPLGDAARAAEQPRTLASLLARRYDSYRANVVEPFFRAHFARLDRQIVLVDALGALNGGAEALANLERGLAGVLAAFRPGRQSWLSFITPRRVGRIVFAATKADHVHRSSHPRLQAILEKAVARAARRASTAGAGVRCIALAALRATEDVEKVTGSETYRCVRGIPLPGQAVAGRAFDGRKPAVVFPGDLPADPLDAFEPTSARPEHYNFVRFMPPERSVQPWSAGGAARVWPHVGLDEIITFLLGDHLP